MRRSHEEGLTMNKPLPPGEYTALVQSVTPVRGGYNLKMTIGSKPKRTVIHKMRNPWRAQKKAKDQS
jgi:hypothetical protein